MSHLATANTCAIEGDDWSFVEAHEANPLFDLVAQRSINVKEVRGGDEYSMVDIQRPSFAQVAALKSARSSTNPTSIQSPIMHAQSKFVASSVPSSLTRQNVNKYGTDYALRKSGKKYVAVKV